MWEHIVDSTFRMKVYGGWLVKTKNEYSTGGDFAMCFVPDPDNKWRL